MDKDKLDTSSTVFSFLQFVGEKGSTNTNLLSSSLLHKYQQRQKY